MAESNTKKVVSHIAGTGYYVNGDYAQQRNIKKSKWPWLPGERKLKVGVPWQTNTHVYDHNDNRIVLWNGIKTNDLDDSKNNQTVDGIGEWSPNSTRSNSASVKVNKNKAYHHWHKIGWNPKKTSSSDVTALKGENCVPITNFTGVSFKWDGYGSYWSNRAICVETDVNVSRSKTNSHGGGVSLTVYNAKTNKIHSLFTFRKAYKGWDIFQERQDNTGDGVTSNDNHVYFEMASADQTYVLNNPVFLVGLTIQCHNDDRGSASRIRQLNFWDLNPIFNPAIGGGYESGGAKLVLPGYSSGALQTQYDIHSRGYTKPVIINLG